MSKYRLCYEEYGILKSIDLSLIKNIKEPITAIETIDSITTKFDTEEDLINYLKRINLVPSTTDKLYISIDKKINNNVVLNKKIYNGEYQVYSDNKDYLNVSFIEKWIYKNKDKYDYIISIAKNYIEKYQNAYNRITGASYILTIFKTLEYYAKLMKDNAFTNNVKEDYENLLREFIEIEFYKYDKVKLSRERKFVIKRDKTNKKITNQRNIHDFIILITNMSKDLNDDYILESNDTLNNNIKEEYIDEEFLTLDDIRNDTKRIIENYDEEDYSYQDGNDFYKSLTKQEIYETLMENGKKLIK